MKNDTRTPGGLGMKPFIPFTHNNNSTASMTDADDRGAHPMSPPHIGSRQRVDERPPLVRTWTALKRLLEELFDAHDAAKVGQASSWFRNVIARNLCNPSKRALKKAQENELVSVDLVGGCGGGNGGGGSVSVFTFVDRISKMGSLKSLMGSLKSLNLASNGLGAEGAMSFAKAIKGGHVRVR
jgi:hypothetical protein